MSGANQTVELTDKRAERTEPIAELNDLPSGADHSRDEAEKTRALKNKTELVEKTISSRSSKQQK